MIGSMKKQYVVMNGKMQQKVAGKIGPIPQPLSPQTAREVEAVWAEWDQRGQPWMSYHDVPALPKDEATP